MPRESDLAYYQRRAREERDLSHNCPSPSALAAHRAMAEAYERKVQALRDTAKAA